MSEISTITSRLDPSEIKSEFELYDEIKLEFPLEQGVTIKEEIDDVYESSTQSKPDVNDEGKIKSEEIVDDNCVLFNTDIVVSIEDRTSVRVFYCDQCNYATNDKKNLTGHILTHRLKCNQCSYTTPDSDTLMNHKQIHLLIGSLQCNVCDYSCIESRFLDQHMLTHVDTNEPQRTTCAFECNECGYQTNSEVILKFHETTHQNKNSEDDLKSSVLITDDSVPSAEKINGKRLHKKKPHCGIGKTKSSLVTYKRSHTEEKLFKCNLCEFRSKYANSLKGHLIQHSGKRPFNCDKCDYKTYLEQRLIVHQRIHAKKTHHKCHLCNFSTKYPTSLKFHIMKHNEKLSFICDKCDYRTFTKYRLLSHKRIHSEEKSFKCELCELSFQYPKTLKLHMMIHYENYLSGMSTKKLSSNTSNCN
ncbi:hypothetical protein FQR65_LT14018 [Abscondita terminalis]|nr:hypothetical protein FQR65_LT14018 [Abscondita terminalis]